MPVVPNPQGQPAPGKVRVPRPEGTLMRCSRFCLVAGLGLALPWLVAVSPSAAQAPKAGGWLNARLREELPQGFAIHETSTISTMWPAMPCLNNLVLFDPLVSTHS